jgi:hypothetical protein
MGNKPITSETTKNDETNDKSCYKRVMDALFAKKPLHLEPIVDEEKAENQHLIPKGKITRCFVIQLKKWNKDYYVKTFISCCTEIFRVVLSTQLILLVPQLCQGEKPSGRFVRQCPSINLNPDATTTDHLCTFYENVYCGNLFKIVTFYYNIFTMSCYAILYVFEISRDLWMIQHFTYNQLHSEFHVVRYMERHRTLFSTLDWYNYIYYLSYEILCFVTIINLILSTISLFYYSYAGLHTITIFTVSIVYCKKKLTTGMLLSYESLITNLPVSYYSSKHMVYNDIDVAYKLSNRPSSKRTMNNMVYLTNLTSDTRFEAKTKAKTNSNSKANSSVKITSINPPKESYIRQFYNLKKSSKSEKLHGRIELPPKVARNDSGISSYASSDYDDMQSAKLDSLHLVKSNTRQQNHHSVNANVPIQRTWYREPCGNDNIDEDLEH